MNSTMLECENGLNIRTANFNRLAQIYRWMEWLSFGPILWRCRCTFLDAMRDRRAALVIGDGDGRFTARLLACNSEITVEALDASEAMLRQLMQRARESAGRVQTRLADARGPMPMTRTFDLVVTHFFLDCLTTAEVESLALEIRRRLKPGAAWVISEFAVPANLYGRLFAGPFVSMLYRAFGLLTGLPVRRLPEYRTALERAGFVLEQEHRRLRGLLVSEIWQDAGSS